MASVGMSSTASGRGALKGLRGCLEDGVRELGVVPPVTNQARDSGEAEMFTAHELKQIFQQLQAAHHVEYNLAEGHVKSMGRCECELASSARRVCEEMASLQRAQAVERARAAKMKRIRRNIAKNR